jgi:hypothetical protein
MRSATKAKEFAGGVPLQIVTMICPFGYRPHGTFVVGQSRSPRSGRILPSGPLRKQLRWDGDALAVSAVVGVGGGQLPGREHEAHQTLRKLLVDMRTALPDDRDVALLEDSVNGS